MVCEHFWRTHFCTPVIRSFWGRDVRYEFAQSFAGAALRNQSLLNVGMPSARSNPRDRATEILVAPWETLGPEDGKNGTPSSKFYASDHTLRFTNNMTV